MSNTTIIITLVLIGLAVIAAISLLSAKSQKKFDNTDEGFSDLLDYSALIDKGVLLLKTGALVASWEYRGTDSESLTNNNLNHRSAQLNNVLRRLGTGWMTHHTVIRRESHEYPEKHQSFFPDAVTAGIDEERRFIYENTPSKHENIMVITLTYLPPPLSSSRLKSMMVEGEEKFNLQGVQDKTIAYFKSKCLEFEDNLSSALSLRRLSEYETVIDIDGNPAIFDEQLEFINYCVTGDNHPVQIPPVAMYLDSYLGAQDFQTGLTPKLGKKYIGVVTIDGFPQTSTPSILDGLDQLPFEYRWTSRFIYEDSYIAVKVLDKFRKKWQQLKRGFVAQLTQNHNAPVNRDAANMEDQTEIAQADAHSGLVTFGYYTSTIIIMDENPEVIAEGQGVVRRLLQSLGFNARVEEANAVEGYLGSLPAHSQENIRRPLMHTLNLADLVPNSTIWPGLEYNPCPYYPPESPALLHTATTGGTPFRFNVHIGDVGHTLIFGPIGAGKSTLVALLAAQARRYSNAVIYSFDKGQSMLPLAYAIEDAKHYMIGDDDSIGFCPLSKIETQADLFWAEEWIISMLILQDVKPTPDQKKAIKSALYQHKNGEDQTLHDFVVTLQDTELRTALENYTVSDTTDYAMLDARTDGLETSSFNVFEIEDLLNMSNAQILPVLTYLFWRIEKSLDGRPTFIFIAEAWIALSHETFRNKIKEWLKVLRKANCAVIMDTQNISDAKESGILDVINEACPTKVYLPNPAARDDSSRTLYGELGLNAREVDLLASSTPKRDYYYRSPLGRRLFRLDLSPFTLSFVGAAGKDDLARIKELKMEYGNNWQQHWLNERGVVNYAIKDTDIDFGSNTINTA